LIRLLFITDNFPPEFNAPASRTFEHINEWNKDNDVEIIVITCFPNFPFGKIYKGYKNKLYKIENINGIKLIRVWSYIAKNEGKFHRIIDFLSFSLMASIVGTLLKTDLIIATSPQFFTTWSAFFISKIKRVPWIFELRDLWPETIHAVNAIKNKKILKILEKVELALYRDCSKVIALTDSFKNNLISRGINKSKIEVIKNGVNLNLFRENANEIKSNLFHNLKDRFLIAYIGTHGMTHGLDFIIKSIPRLKIKNIHFIFIGDGAMKVMLKKLAKELFIENITFLDSIKKEEIPSYYSSIDVALVVLKKNKTFEKVIPSKIFEACALSRPILLGVDGEAKELIKQYNAGVSFVPENLNEFRKSILKLMDKKYYKRCQLGCKNLANDFNREDLANKMLKILKNTVN
tara:strand:- start:114 stop:1328 length:1215 start_codon:yes stop_codon:yes gene_type:complete